MTGTVCCVPECKKNSKFDRDVSFHKFPQNMKEMLFFIKKINRKRNHKMGWWTPSMYHKICSLHYKQIKKEYNKLTRAEAESINVQCIDVGAEIDIHSENMNEEINITQINVTPRSEIFQLAHKDHNYSLLEDNKIYKAQEEITILKKQLAEAESKYNDQLLKTNFYKNRFINTEMQMNESIWNIEEIIQNKKQLHFYTGFRDSVYFFSFVKFIKPAYDLAMQTVKTKGKFGRPAKLSFEQQLLLVLIKLKLGLFEEDLAYRFKIGQSTVSSIWSFWVNLLNNQLTKVPLEPDKSTAQNYVPECIKLLKKLMNNNNKKVTLSTKANIEKN